MPETLFFDKAGSMIEINEQPNAAIADRKTALSAGGGQYVSISRPCA
ncbi:MAG TPA: hypothetical protein VKA18_10640 [Alphaproteobacteria bacterium]|nr:hypothetical protein [Alphaproteobacteria bacterium]